MAAGAIMDGARGGIDVPKSDIDRIKSHLAKYYQKMGESRPGNEASTPRHRRQRAIPFAERGGHG